MSAASTTANTHNTVVLIPAFNEAAIVGKVVDKVRSYTGLPVVVIDDASDDQTIAEAETAGATVIPLPAQLGAWGAMQTGLRYALRNGYDYAVTMDADGQHKAEAIAQILGPVQSNQSDVVIGACTERGSVLRRIAWVIMKRTSGLALEDLTSGFRAYNRDAIRTLAGWRATLLDYQDIGVLLLLQRHSLRIVDVQVEMCDRQQGRSRVFHSWLIVAYYMCCTLLLGLTKRNLLPGKNQ